MRTIPMLFATALLASLSACTEGLEHASHQEDGDDGAGAAALVTVPVDPTVTGLVTPKSCAVSKVLICHIPNGNPANAHNICVSDGAAVLHAQQHGDTVGGCKAEAREAPVCLPQASVCSESRECCSNACIWSECIDHI